MPPDDTEFDPATFLARTASAERDNHFDLKVVADSFLENDARKRFKEIPKVEARIYSLEKSLTKYGYEIRRGHSILIEDSENPFQELQQIDGLRAAASRLFSFSKSINELEAGIAIQFRHHEELLTMYAKFQRMTRPKWSQLTDAEFLKRLQDGTIHPMETGVSISPDLTKNQYVTMSSELFDLYINYYRETLDEAVAHEKFDRIYGLCYTIKFMDALRYSLQLRGYPSEFTNENYKKIKLEARKWASEYT